MISFATPSTRLNCALLISAFLITGCSNSNDSTTVENELTPPNDATETVESNSPTTQVNFAISVPAYSSEELQIRLTWGEINSSAAWVSDESWTLSETFPADTENQLVVTFADRNGDITLGRFEESFRTGTGASETVQITADQFDTVSSDSDGRRNLATASLRKSQQH